MTSSNAIRLTTEVLAAPSDVFRAFASARALKTWLCEEAICTPRVGGFISLWWKDGEHASGEFTAFEPGRRLALTWMSRGNAQPSKVSVTLDDLNGSARLHLTHSGFGADSPSTIAIKAWTARWTRYLANLAVVWGERGIDRRFLTRPGGEPRASLGFFYGPPTLIDAAPLPPNSWGIEVVGAPASGAAYKAGLRQGDVVLSVGGRPTCDIHSFSEALDHVPAGTQVTVSYVRAGRVLHTKVHTATVPETLPLPPDDPKALAEDIETRYRQFDDELDELLKGVSEETAAAKPREDAWSINDVLAHLIPFERMFHNWLGATVSDFEMISWIKHPVLWTDGLIDVYPTLSELREALRRARAETVAYLRRVPLDFAQTATYRRMGMILIMDQFHPAHHHEQIRRILRDLRNRVSHQAETDSKEN